MSVTSLPNAIRAELYSAQNESEELTFLQKLKYIVTHITVEPLIFFYLLPGTMGYLATQNMNLDKACRVNLEYNSTICDALTRRDRSGYEPFHEENIQNLVSRMVTIKTAIVGFFPTCLLLFFGSWSDRHRRRKPVILMPIFGDIVSYVCLFICAVFFLELSVEYSTLADAVPFSLGGGTPCMALGVYSYVSGISSNNDRTIRIGAVSMFQSTAIAIGNALGGIFIKPLGYKGVYITAVFIMATIFVYGILVIKDPNEFRENTKSTPFFKDFFDVKHIKNTMNICFAKNKENRRRKMITIIFLTVMLIGPFNGEIAVLYLYTRMKFGWNEVDYSIFNTLQFFVQMIGSIFALSFFSKFLKLNDAQLGFLAMFSKISACLIYAFAPSGYYFFIGVFVEIFHGTAHIALRSIISKIVPPEELGQSSSIFGICEAVMPLAFGPLYTILYSHTIQAFPGTFYFVSAGIYAGTLMLFYWLHKTIKLEEKSLVSAKRKGQKEELIKKKISIPAGKLSEGFQLTEKA